MSSARLPILNLLPATNSIRSFHSSTAPLKKFKPQKLFLLPDETPTLQRKRRKEKESLDRAKKYANKPQYKPSYQSSFDQGNRPSSSSFGLQRRPRDDHEFQEERHDDDQDFGFDNTTGQDGRNVWRDVSKGKEAFGIRRSGFDRSELRTREEDGFVAITDGNQDPHSLRSKPRDSFSERPDSYDGSFKTASKSATDWGTQKAGLEEMISRLEAKEQETKHTKTSATDAPRTMSPPVAEPKKFPLSSEWRTPTAEQYAKYDRSSATSTRSRTPRLDSQRLSQDRKSRRDQQEGMENYKPHREQLEGAQPNHARSSSPKGLVRPNLSSRNEPRNSYQQSTSSFTYDSYAKKYNGDVWSTPASSPSPAPAEPDDRPSGSWSPTKRISRPAMEGIQTLYAQDPVKWNRIYLSKQFGVSVEAVTRILKSDGRWRKSDAKDETANQPAV